MSTSPSLVLFITGSGETFIAAGNLFIRLYVGRMAGIAGCA
jgi:hypothetical protein